MAAHRSGASTKHPKHGPRDRLAHKGGGRLLRSSAPLKPQAEVSIGRTVKADRPTSITVPSSIAKRLRLYKAGGRSYADVLAELMDAVPPKSFQDWAEKELTRPVVSYSEIRSKLGLRSR